MGSTEGRRDRAPRKKIAVLVYRDLEDGETAECPVSREALMEIEHNCSHDNVTAFCRWILDRMGEKRRKGK